MEKLRFGMIGGGSNFGRMHIRSAVYDNLAEITAGCFSRTSAKNVEIGKTMGIASERCYPDYHIMAETEALHPDRIDFVIISTPNKYHYEMAKLFLDKGFPVMLDKPMSINSHEAEELAVLADKKGLPLGLSYTYTGFPIIQQMKKMITDGKIGKINMIVGEFPQSYLAEQFYHEGTISTWRTKRDIAGISCCTADIGIHIECLVRYLTGLDIEKLSACLDSFDYKSELELNSMVMLRFKGGAVGQYFASQVSAGYFNDIRIRIFGSLGTLEWELKNADRLLYSRFGEPNQIMLAARPFLYSDVKLLSRTGQGVPEGSPGALAQIYRLFCGDISKMKNNEKPLKMYTSGWDGVASMKYIEAVIKSSHNDSAWVTME